MYGATAPEEFLFKKCLTASAVSHPPGCFYGWTSIYQFQLGSGPNMMWTTWSVRTLLCRIRGGMSHGHFGMCRHDLVRISDLFLYGMTNLLLTPLGKPTWDFPWMFFEFYPMFPWVPMFCWEIQRWFSHGFLQAEDHVAAGAFGEVRRRWHLFHLREITLWLFNIAMV